MSRRVLISDAVDPICPRLLEEHGFTPEAHPDAGPEELKDLARSVAGWIIRSGTTVTADLIEAAENLKVIGRAGVGVDNIDLAAATRRGVLVVNAPDGNTITTAEHACAMLQALARRIPQANASLRSGAWNRKAFAGTELHGKTLGILGVGKIGRTVAERMQGFGLRFVGHDPYLSEEVAARLGLTLVSFEDLLAQSDFITVHTPLNDATRGLLDADALAQCKDGVMIVNCARGGIVDEEALLKALESGQVGGAALDVYSQEPPPEALDALIGHPNVVATPHIAASTGEAQAKVARQITEQVIHALKGEAVATPVNGMGLRSAAQPEVQPYLRLADRLGQIAVQLGGGRLRRLTVRCHGDLPHRYAEVLSVAALKGVLQRWSDVPVNLINAPVLAEEMGLRVTEERDTIPGSYTHLVEVEVETEDEVRRVAGTVLDGDDPRLVRVDDYWLEVRPEGHLLFYRNVDRPGMLAAVGGLLAAADVNIAALALGRADGRGTTALTAISMDDAIPADVIADMAALDGVEAVQPVSVEEG